MRIGIARCDPGGLLASPLEPVRRGPGDLAAIAGLAVAHEAIEVIVGLAIGLAGREGKAAAEGRSFAYALAERRSARRPDRRLATPLVRFAVLLTASVPEVA